MLFMTAVTVRWASISARIWAAWRALSPTFAVSPLRPNLSGSGALLASTEGSLWIQAQLP
jgi:hypothetical protein